MLAMKDTPKAMMNDTYLIQMYFIRAFMDQTEVLPTKEEERRDFEAEDNVFISYRMNFKPMKSENHSKEQMEK